MTRGEKIDKMTVLINKHMDELERRRSLEKTADQLICEGKYKEAIEVYKSIDDSIIQSINEEIEQLKAIEPDTTLTDTIDEVIVETCAYVKEKLSEQSQIPRMVDVTKSIDSLSHLITARSGMCGYKYEEYIKTDKK